jgi:hypothetical protein
MDLKEPLMFNRIPKPILSALLAAVIGAVCACNPDEVAPPPTDPAVSLQASPKPLSFVGTVPVSRIDERAVTPTETVGAASN